MEDVTYEEEINKTLVQLETSSEPAKYETKAVGFKHPN